MDLTSVGSFHFADSVGASEVGEEEEREREREEELEEIFELKAEVWEALPSTVL